MMDSNMRTATSTRPGRSVARACDGCRRRRIKCQPIPSSNPPRCAQCASHGDRCTWFRPISQTRTKRARTDQGPGTRTEDSDAMSGCSGGTSTILSQGHGMPAPSPPWQNTLPSLVAPSYGSQFNESRVRGPTSVSHILHSSTNFSKEHLVRHNSRYRTYAEIKPSGRDAIIRIQDLVTPDSESSSPATADPSWPHPRELPPQLIDRLLRFYFDTHAEIFPVVSKDVFVSSKPVIPQLIYTMCGISAMTHTANVPPNVLEDVRANLALIHRYQDAADDCSLQQVQALLIFSLVLELDHRSISRSNWNRLGLAIRKAQDLGLHREMYQEEESDAELRRQIWGGLIVADRWIAAIQGLPMMIDLVDCDRLFPRDEAFRALIQVSILLGKVMRLLYTPAGITRVTDSLAESMAAEIDAWAASLPARLRVDLETPAGSDKAPTAGLLELLLVAVKFLFARPFMRVSYTTDILNYSIPADFFQDIFIRSRRAIDWARRNKIMLEGWQFGYYALFFSALIQYQAYSKSQMGKYLEALKACVDVFEETAVPGCHARAKLAEITRLLYTAACCNKGNEVNEAINPVFGVRQRSEGDDLSPRTSDPGVPQYIVPTPATQEPEATSRQGGDLARSLLELEMRMWQRIRASLPSTDSNTTDTVSGTTVVDLEEINGATGEVQLPDLLGGTLNINPLMQEVPRAEHVFEPSMDIFAEIGNFDQWNSDAWNALLAANEVNYDT